MDWGLSGRLLSNPQFWENKFYSAPIRLQRKVGCKRVETLLISQQQNLLNNKKLGSSLNLLKGEYQMCRESLLFRSYISEGLQSSLHSLPTC